MTKAVPVHYTENPPTNGSVQSREKIFNAATRLFMQKGYKSTSLVDIANAAGINKVTIYYYFKNKMSLLYEIAVAGIYEIIKMGEPILASDLPAEKKLSALIYNHIKWNAFHPGRAGFYLFLQHNLSPKLHTEYLTAREEYLALIETVIQEGQSSGEFKRPASFYNALLIVRFLNALGQRLDADGEEKESIESTLKSAYRLLMAFLRPIDRIPPRD